jgi:GTP-dependent dephospho-CoA kinase
MGLSIFGGGMSKKRPTLHLPDTWRDELKNTLGPIITDEELPKHVKGQLLAVIGDVAAVHIIRAGYKPKLVIVDFKTRRGDAEALAPEIRLIGKERIKVLNPPTQITPALWDAVEKAYKLEGPVRIEVEGEEDLASLVCIVTAPIGSLVIYGMPGQGMAVVTVNKKNKVMAQKALDSMRKA